MLPIRINGGIDAASGKKVKYELNHLPISVTGYPEMIAWKTEYYENDNNTPAVPAGNTLRQKRLVETFVSRFDFQHNQVINTTTRVFAPLEPDGSLTPGTEYLDEYLTAKVINTYQGVGAVDRTDKFFEGYFREIMSVLVANGIA